MSVTRLTFAFCVLAIAASTFVHAAPADRAIHYRQDVFGLIGWNFGALNEMVREKRPWDSAEFAHRTERIAQLSKMTDESFPIGSHAGATTDAKPEIWDNLDDFNALLADLLVQADALSSVAKGDDQSAIKSQFAKTAGACKACHDKYKAD